MMKNMLVTSGYKGAILNDDIAVLVRMFGKCNDSFDETNNCWNKCPTEKQI